MLGLKKGTISFIERNEEWDTIAQREIEHLKVLFGPCCKRCTANRQRSY